VAPLDLDSRCPLNFHRVGQVYTERVGEEIGGGGGGGDVSGTTFSIFTGGETKFYSSEVPQAVPVRPSGKGCVATR
jgi:hypothetical protein